MSRSGLLILIVCALAAVPITARGADAPGGKPGREFWSFRPLTRAEVPGPKDASKWDRNVIDRFVLTAQEAKGLTPSPEADRGTLVRRVYFDVVGLPPSPAELDAALKDPSPDWYEQLVDRLLASPHFGERWGRHWLDAARFAESDGYEGDMDRPTAWHYRDFVIRAFNEDLPYDKFVKWQIAGDEYEPQNPRALAATGFLAAAPVARSTVGTKRDIAENRLNEIDDMLATTGSAMLGLTVGCARCHDHKFDPVPTRDYYRMLAAFAGAARLPEPPKPLPGGAPVKFTAKDTLGPPLHVTDASPAPATFHLLNRGDVEKPVEPAPLGFLSVLTPAEAPGDPGRWLTKDRPAEAKTSGQRRAMAEWMTDIESGAGALLARVIVNRLWQHHFGQGLVRTAGDFGTQGERPSHPHLLDWLAAELIRNQWRLKPIHRLMLTSGTYRQSTAHDPARASIDPDNRFLWRRRPARLEAEILRDSILAASGQLKRDVYGPSVKPYIPPAAMAGRNKDGLERPKQDEPRQWRRSVYLFVKRSLPEPMLTTFDAPAPASSCARRTVSTVPTQALVLLNDPFVRRQAAFFAERCVAEAPGDAAGRVRHAYRVALSREPTERELDAAVRFLGPKADRAALTDLCHVLLGLNEFAYVD